MSDLRFSARIGRPLDEFTRAANRRRTLALAEDDDLVRDLRADQLAGIEPLDISDLLEIADQALTPTHRGGDAA